MKAKVTILFLALVTFFTSAIAQTINLDDVFNKSKKPVLFYFHTSWCVYCGLQSRMLKKDVGLIKELQSEFNVIDFDAESDIEVSYKNYQIKNVNPQKYKPHPFVEQFKNKGETGYPLWVLADSNLFVQFIHQGHLKKKQLKELVDFYKTKRKSSN